MIRYMHVLLACADQVWAIERGKLNLIVQFLQIKARGENVSEQEIARITKKEERSIAQRPGDIAIIPVVGTIMQRASLMDDISGGISTQSLAAAHRAALMDDSVKAIIYDFDSPGGVAAGIDEFATELYYSRGQKPIIAQVNSYCCSAAYWLASQMDEVVVTPSARGGSIGVYTIHEDISKMMEMEGVKTTLVASHANKVEGNEFEPLGPEAFADLQTKVLEVDTRFSQAVARGRNVSLGAVRKQFGQGKVFTAAEMVERKMADSVATIDQTMERFGVMTNPIASRNMRGDRARVQAQQTLGEKLKAGVQPTVRELEEGFKGLFLMSNSEAEAAAKLFVSQERTKPPTNGGSGNAEAAALLAQISQRLDGIAASINPK